VVVVDAEEAVVVVVADEAVVVVAEESVVVVVVEDVDVLLLPSWLSRRHPRTERTITIEKRMLNVCKMEKSGRFYTRL